MCEIDKDLLFHILSLWSLLDSVEKYLTVSGPCDDSDDTGYCDNPKCRYCNMVKAFKEVDRDYSKSSKSINGS